MIRRFQLLVVAAILLIAAFSTELEFLFYLVYLSILVIGGSGIMALLLGILPSVLFGLAQLGAAPISAAGH